MRLIAYLWTTIRLAYWQTIVERHGLVTYVDSYRDAQYRCAMLQRRLRALAEQT